MNQNDAERMMEMITGYWVTQVVHALAMFSIADHLAKGPATAEEIADVEGTDPSATFRLLRTCASLGLVKYVGDSRFAGTSLLDTLRKGQSPEPEGYCSLMAFTWALAAMGALRRGRENGKKPDGPRARVGVV